MREKVVVDVIGFFLTSLGLVFIFTLFGQDVYGYIFVGLGIVMFFGGWYLMVQSQKMTSYLSMKYYLKNKDTKKLYEENLKYRKTITDSYNTFEDLLGIILLSLQRDKKMLPIFQSMYKNTRGAQRLSKSNTYMLSFLIENKIEDFVKEYQEIIKVKNYVLEKGIAFRDTNEAPNWLIDEELVHIFYRAYEHGEKVQYDNVKNDMTYLVFVVIYYQYLQNTEQTSLAQDYESEYHIIMKQTME